MSKDLLLINLLFIFVGILLCIQLSAILYKVQWKENIVELVHRCLQLLRSSCEGIINAIDEFYDIFFSLDFI
jgi:hypothetical protein